MSANLGIMQTSHGIKGSAYFPMYPGQRSTESSNQQRPNVVPLDFPATKDVLWDKTPTGESTVLHITKYRNIGLHVLEKSVQLAYRHALQSDIRPYKCFLIGSVINDKDEEGMTLAIDRFDPGRDIPGRGGRMPTARLPGDQVIPLTVSVNDQEASTTHTVDDFSAAFKVIDHAFSSTEPLDLGHALSSRIHCCCYDGTDDVTLNIHMGAVTMGNALEATPISPIHIIPTALARNLTGPLNLSEIQGAPKVGFVTMDQTRKLLLVLESDPKACSLPLVGIWLSGVSNLCSPFVWASCLRYMFNNGIHERVCTADRGFLLVMFSPTNRQPAFYECRSLNGLAPSFELVGCRENIHLYKHSDQTSRAPVQLELTTARDGPNRAMFLDAAKQYTPNSQSLQVAKQSHKLAKPAPAPHLTTAAEDGQIVPRPSPKPMIDKSPTVKPSVPELSLIFDSSDEEFGQPVQTLDSGLSTQPRDAPQSVVVSQWESTQYNHSRQQQPSNFIQEGQENPGQKGRTGFSNNATRARGHVETPRGRPGPLKPVNMNLPHAMQNFQKSTREDVNVKHNHHLQRGIKTGPVVKRSSLGSVPTKTPSSHGKRGNHQWPADGRTGPEMPWTNRTPESDCTPRQRPPRPVANNMDIAVPANAANPKSAPCHEKRRAPPRRMSYPVPAKTRQQKAHSTNSQTHIHKLENPAAPHVQKSSPKHNSSKQSLSDSGVFMNTMNSTMSPSYGEAMGHSTNGSTPQTGSVVKTTSLLTQTPHASPFPEIPKTLSFTPGHAPTPSSLSDFQPVENPAVTPTASRPPHQILGAPENRCPVANSDIQNTQSEDSCYPNSMPLHTPSPLPQDKIAHHHTQAIVATPRNRLTSVSTPEVGAVSVESRPSAAEHQVPSNTRGAAIETNEAMVQLKRQEKLIQQLQAQIQMLLQAQTSQSTPPLPSGLITPPATPSSQGQNNQKFIQMPTPKTTPSTTTHVQTHSPSTGQNTPPLKTTCNIAVMTGKSLLWPDETGSPVQNPKNRTSIGTSMTPRASPSKEPPLSPPTIAKAAHDSDPELTLPLQHRDDTRSSAFNVSTMDFQSFSEGSSARNALSPARIPEEMSPKENNVYHDNDEETSPSQGTYLMDSFQSPVLGESASTCAPPRRRGHHSGGSDTSSDDDSESSEESEADGGLGMDSLLQKDEQKFYQNILGKVEKMLADQFSTIENDQQGKSMVHVAHQELMGVTSPMDHGDLATDTSLVYRSMCMVNSDFYPRINYVSLMDVHLDSPNLSYEANAIAMKYLTEDELTQLSAGFNSQATPPQPKVNPLLRTALTGMGDVSMAAGLSAVDLSMASRKYMEKYGLLETRKKPDRARALGFESINETPTQPKKSTRKGSNKSKDHRNCRKKDDFKGSENIQTPPGIFEAKTQGASPNARPLAEISPEQESGAKDVRKNSETVPRRKIPYQGNLQAAPTTVKKQLKNKKHDADANRGEEFKKTNDENKRGSNILDIERLKQLPKLF